MIQFTLNSLSIRIPHPTQEVVASLKEHLDRGTRTVTRTPNVLLRQGFVVLDFEGLDGGFREHGPFGGPLSILVRHFAGVQDSEQAKNHFFAEQGEHVEKALKHAPSAMTRQEHPTHTVLNIDLGEAGWAPGNSYVYVLLASPHVGALSFFPTNYLYFDWNELVVERTT